MIVVSPSRDNRVEHHDERLLPGGLVGFYNPPDLLQKLLLRLLGRSREQRVSEFPDVEPKEVEPLADMRDFRLFLGERKPSFGQEPAHEW